MSCLDATFTLTPKTPLWAPGQQRWAGILCYGVDFLTISPWDLPSSYSGNRFYYSSYTAADPTVNYSDWANRMKVHHIYFWADLRSFGPTKSLALVFAFETAGSGRVLICSDAGQIADRTLSPSDNQFLMEVESLQDQVKLYFIHAGDSWFFKGISGYVV